MADLGDLCEVAVGAAESGEAVEAYAGQSRRTEVKARGGEVDSLARSETRGIGVRVIADGRLGYAWAADPDRDEIAGLVASAREAARHAASDEANVLPEAEAAEPLPGLFREAQASLGSERKVELALELDHASTSSHPDVRKVEEVIYADVVSRVAIASTAGVQAERTRTDCWCMVSALAERDGETQSGFSFAVARELDELDWRGAAAEAAERGARLLGATKPSTERLPVVLDPWAASSFLGVLAGALSAEEVQKGRSLFAGKVGDSVGAGILTLVDDGRLPDGPGSTPFDDEGVPTGRTPLIEAGVLRGFLHNAQTAARGGTRSTGNAGRAGYRSVPGVSPANLVVEPGDDGPEAVLAQAGRGVYVQSVTGVHSGANPVSGEFSVGATGLRIEEGSLGEPLREMTIASTLQDVLGALVAIGSDLRFFPGGGAIGTPTMLVGEMTVAGA
ncbi:MAG TPA: TldD/PmbA family protein [Actinomycetota bacterium]